jgi:hypothetical protein
MLEIIIMEVKYANYLHCLFLASLIWASSI